MADQTEWQKQGFAAKPKRKTAPKGGLLLYRAWGANSTEAGTGFFSLEKPSSVLDAELRLNIADWGNGVHFITTFRLREGFRYLVGPVAHGEYDLSRPGIQVLVEVPLEPKIEKVGVFEVLKHDVVVVQHAGNA